MYRDAVLRTSRVYPHVPPVVYEAFEVPGLLAVWWGPDGSSNVFERFEFTRGGRWEFVTIGPDGARHRNESTFVELEPDSYVVIRHEMPLPFKLEVHFVPLPGGTQLTWTQSFDDVTMLAALRHIVEPANEQNLDRLARVLPRVPTGAVLQRFTL